MTLSSCSHRRSRSRRSGQILLVAVLLMIVIAVLGSTFAALLVSAHVNRPIWTPQETRQTIA